MEKQYSLKLEESETAESLKRDSFFVKGKYINYGLYNSGAKKYHFNTSENKR